MLARSVRYYVEGTLAVFYGEQVVDFLRHNGMVMLSVAAALVLLGIVCYLFWTRLKTKRAVAKARAEMKTESETGTT